MQVLINHRMADTPEISSAKSDIAKIEQKVQSLPAEQQVQYAPAIADLKKEIGEQNVTSQTADKISGLKAMLQISSPAPDATNAVPKTPPEAEKVSELSKKSFEVAKKVIDSILNAPLSVPKLQELLSGIEKADETGKAFILQYIVSKLRNDGHLLVIWKDATTQKDSLELVSKGNEAHLLRETLRNALSKNIFSLAQIEQSLIVSSDSLKDYSSTLIGKNPTKTTKDYVRFLRERYDVKSPINPAAIQNDPKIPASDKALLISTKDNAQAESSIESAIALRETFAKQAAEYFTAPEFKKAEAAIAKISGKPPLSPKSVSELADQVAKDPAGALSGKPMTTLAAGLAIFYGLGYSKHEGFSLWTGLKRGFIGLIAILFGTAVAKEWGMEPKKLLKEGIDFVKDHKKKVEKDDDDDEDNEKKKWTKKGKKKEEKENEVELTPSQKKAVEKIKKHPQINQMIDAHAKAQEKSKGAETANLDTYLAFIHSEGFQNRKMQDIVNPKNFDESIFSNEMDFNKNNQNNLNSILLKKVLRLYITGTYETSEAAPNTKRGIKEKDQFLEANKGKMSPTKTFAEITTEIYWA